MNHINVHMLAALDACPEQVSLFGKVFGEGDVALSAANIIKAVNNNLSVLWLCQFLDDEAEAEYHTVFVQALAEYQTAAGLAWDEYNKAGTLALYDKARDLAYYKYVKAVGLAIIRLL